MQTGGRKGPGTEVLDAEDTKRHARSRDGAGPERRAKPVQYQLEAR